MKKLLSVTLAALMLSACSSNQQEQHITGVPSETAAATSLTLAEDFTAGQFTEPVPEKDEGEILAELAVFNPFSDLAEIDENTREELIAALKKIQDGWAFFTVNPNAFPDDSVYRDNYADTSVIMEINPENGFCYSPLNPELAADEEELINYFRSVFSESYIGENYEESIGTRIFNEGLPYYKTIDGTLCMLTKPMTGARRIIPDKFIVLDYDGNTAELLVENQNSSSGRYFSHIRITKHDEYGWRQDMRDGEPPLPIRNYFSCEL